MKVAVVAPYKGSSGIGDYAESLTTSLEQIEEPVEVERFEFSPSANTPLGLLLLIPGISRTNADVVHVQHEYGLFGPLSVFSFLFFPLLWFVTRARGMPLALTFHETITSEHAQPPLTRTKSLYARLLNRVLISTVDQVVFLSEHAQKRLHEDTRIDSSTTLPHGVDLGDRRDLSKSEARSILDIPREESLVVEPGYVSPRKGSHIFASLAAELPETRFLLAGGSSEADDSYIRKVRDSMPENCDMTGVLDEEAFHAAFAAADVVVLPYLETEQAGIVNQVSQSGIFNWCAAYRVPTVASECSYFETLADKWGCVETASADDISALATAVEQVLEENEKRESLVANLETYARENSFDTVAERHADLYEELVATSS